MEIVHLAQIKGGDVMAKRPDYVLRRNAERGAMTTWCPTCDRKSALGQIYSQGVGIDAKSYRDCRYCGTKIGTVEQAIARKAKAQA